MSDLVVTLVGIITLSCGAPAAPGQDTCTGTVPKVEVLIPDGRFHAKDCKKDNTTDPSIEPHEAFIRIRGARATATPAWPGAIQCSDLHKGAPCVLYPLQKRTLSIDHVSTGNGTTFTNLDSFDEIRWSKLYGDEGLPLPTISGQKRIASMTIANGEITYDTAENMGNAIVARVTVKNVRGPWVMHANSTSNVLKLTVPATATVDILSVPRFLAVSDFATTHIHDDCDHFFLHYHLSEDEPEKDCPYPKDGKCPKASTTSSTLDLGATIACSNSNFP